MGTERIPSRRIIAWIDAQPPQSIRRLLFACLALFVWSLDTHGNYAGSGDEPHYGMIAHSLVFDRDLDLSNDYADPANLVGAGTLTPESHAVPGVGGRLRPVHDIGLPLLSTPVFAVAYWIAERSPSWLPADLMRRTRLNPPLVLRHLISLGMIMVAGGVALVLFDVLLSIARSKVQAFLWALVFALSPPLVSHSYLFFTEIPSALIVLVCFRQLNAGGEISTPRAALLGTLVGVLILLHIRNIGLVGGFVLWFFWRLRLKPDHLSVALTFVAPLATLAAIRTAINFHFWGTLVSGPLIYYNAPTEATTTLAEMGARALGLLVDQEHGLLAYAPVYVLTLPGLLMLWRSNRSLCLALLLMIASYCLPVLLPMSNPYGWAGGWSPAARFLVPIAPLCAVAAFACRASFVTRPRFLTALVALQWILNAIYWSKPKVLWNDGTGRSALATFISPSWLDLAPWLPSWHTPSPYSTTLSALVVLAWMALSIRASKLAAH